MSNPNVGPPKHYNQIGIVILTIVLIVALTGLVLAFKV